jgi:hypothetical protein
MGASYTPGVAPEPRGSLSSALADLLAGKTTSAVVKDPAFLGGSLNRYGSREFVDAALNMDAPVEQVAAAFQLPVTAVERIRQAGRRGVDMTTQPGSVRRVITADSLGIGPESPIAERARAIYGDLLNPARRTEIYRDPVTMDYMGGLEKMLDPVDWGTGLPSDVPIPLRGAAGYVRRENDQLGGDAGGFVSQDPASVSLRTRRLGAEAESFGMANVVWANGDGTYTIRRVDPTLAAEQRVLDPDSTAPFGRSEDMSIGSAVQGALNENQTPVIIRPRLAAQREERSFFPVPLGKREGTLVGTRINQGSGFYGPGGAEPSLIYAPETDGRPLMTAVEGPGGIQMEQVYRIGSATNRDEEAVRAALREIPQLATTTVTAPQATRPVNLAQLISKMDEGYEIVSPETPLLAGSPEALKARLTALRGQPFDPEVVNPLASRLDVYRAGAASDAPLQSLVPEVQNGRYTGRVLPLAQSEAGPAILLGDALARIKGEEFGSRRAGLNEREVGLEGTTRGLGKGAYMESPNTADGVSDVIVPMIFKGELTPEQIQADPRLSRMFREGSHARQMLEQELSTASRGKMQLLPTIPRSAEKKEAQIRSQYLFPDRFGKQPVLFGSQQYGETGGGQAEQLAAAARSLAARQGGNNSYVIGESNPVSPYQADPYGGGRSLAEIVPLPGGELRYTPSYIDDVAAYMARDARERGLSMPPEPVEAPTIPIPGMGFGEATSTLVEPTWNVGRRVGPYAGAPYYGTLDRSQYRATVPGMREFNYEGLAGALGAEPGSFANEAALKFLAERLRRRQQGAPTAQSPATTAVLSQPSLF